MIPCKLEDVSGMAVFLKSYPRSPLLISENINLISEYLYQIYSALHCSDQDTLTQETFI